MVRRALAVAIVAAIGAGSVILGGGVAGAAPPPARCGEPVGREFQRAAPEDTGVDSAGLADALQFAASRNRLNVKVFHHNCLIGEGPTNAETDDIPWNVWSVTKSVVSLLAGIAWDQGKLDIEAPLDRYLPPGIGQPDHRAITVENLLQETSGLRVGAVTEGITGIVPIDPFSAVQALGVPFEDPPGSAFQYSQRNVDLLSYVIELAVGEPLQQFAQRELFDPLGIARTDYYWARDRSGHTYGYAHLLIPPADLARLGMLVAEHGEWNGRTVVSAAYLTRATTPSDTNHCYGYLLWTGPGCAENPGFLPADMYSMSGLGLQHVYVVPSLDLMVVWTGVFGVHTAQGPSGILQYGDEPPHEFFRRLLAALRDNPIPDPGPYVEAPLSVDVRGYFDPDITLAVFGVGADAYPGCNLLSCLNLPLHAPFTDAPPGCLIVACLGPDPRTPGIR
ncbi:class C beta-lactamase-related serine hydrolase [Nocardia yunnanensis]|uniref:Class C beta-lactamase-related serine hydrolase n=1 Tax=Nocardia yunnanensis TaxID=2382165 RepID=A0A386Z659_9NOCA|nr:serine hydrolase [Nocardia yunnanensis]AYF73086.1 class C beta-lactamase-related serine hydrolase [Nocardia yunnanensis]